MKSIMTVLGPVDASDLGFTLPHEHVMVDFAGAQITGPDRYDRTEVIRRMEPYLNEAHDAGVRGLVECSPMYLARDVRVLRELSERTGMHIVTNTGQYKEPFLPANTFTSSAKDLADDWIREWEDGIDGTDVRPGFIKTAVEPGPLSETHAKLIDAAALTSSATGLTIGTHTGDGLTAIEILRTLDRRGVPPSKWIFIHADQERDHELIRLVSREGCWIELDSIGNSPDNELMRLLLKLLDWGHEDRLLLSHDAGWYTVGEPDGGTPRPYTHLTSTFVPQMRRIGISEESIRRMTVANPASAFALGE